MACAYAGVTPLLLRWYLFSISPTHRDLFLATDSYAHTLMNRLGPDIISPRRDSWIAIKQMMGRSLTPAEAARVAYLDRMSAEDTSPQAINPQLEFINGLILSALVSPLIQSLWYSPTAIAKSLMVVGVGYFLLNAINFLQKDALENREYLGFIVSPCMSVWSPVLNQSPRDMYFGFPLLKLAAFDTADTACTSSSTVTICVSHGKTWVPVGKELASKIARNVTTVLLPLTSVLSVSASGSVRHKIQLMGPGLNNPPFTWLTRTESSDYGSFEKFTGFPFGTELTPDMLNEWTITPFPEPVVRWIQNHVDARPTWRDTLIPFGLPPRPDLSKVAAQERVPPPDIPIQLNVLGATLTPGHISGTPYEGGQSREVVRLLQYFLNALLAQPARMPAVVADEFVAARPKIVQFLDALDHYVAFEIKNQKISSQLSQKVPPSPHLSDLFVDYFINPDHRGAINGFFSNVFSTTRYLTSLRQHERGIIPAGYAVNAGSGHAAALIVQPRQIGYIIDKIDIGAGMDPTVTTLSPLGYRRKSVRSGYIFNLPNIVGHAMLFESLKGPRASWPNAWRYFYQNATRMQFTRPQYDRHPQLSGTCFAEWELIAFDQFIETLSQRTYRWVDTEFRSMLSRWYVESFSTPRNISMGESYLGAAIMNRHLNHLAKGVIKYPLQKNANLKAAAVIGSIDVDARKVAPAIQTKYIKLVRKAHMFKQVSDLSRRYLETKNRTRLTQLTQSKGKPFTIPDRRTPWMNRFISLIESVQTSAFKTATLSEYRGIAARIRDTLIELVADHPKLPPANPLCQLHGSLFKAMVITAAAAVRTAEQSREIGAIVKRSSIRFAIEAPILSNKETDFEPPSQNATFWILGAHQVMGLSPNLDEDYDQSVAFLKQKHKSNAPELYAWLPQSEQKITTLEVIEDLHDYQVLSASREKTFSPATLPLDYRNLAEILCDLSSLPWIQFGAPPPDTLNVSHSLDFEVKKLGAIRTDIIATRPNIPFFKFQPDETPAAFQYPNWETRQMDENLKLAATGAFQRIKSYIRLSPIDGLSPLETADLITIMSAKNPASAVLAWTDKNPGWVRSAAAIAHIGQALARVNWDRTPAHLTAALLEELRTHLFQRISEKSPLIHEIIDQSVAILDVLVRRRPAHQYPAVRSTITRLIQRIDPVLATTFDSKTITNLTSARRLMTGYLLNDPAAALTWLAKLMVDRTTLSEPTVTYQIRLERLARFIQKKFLDNHAADALQIRLIEQSLRILWPRISGYFPNQSTPPTQSEIQQGFSSTTHVLSIPGCPAIHIDFSTRAIRIWHLDQWIKPTIIPKPIADLSVRFPLDKSLAFSRTDLPNGLIAYRYANMTIFESGPEGPIVIEQSVMLFPNKKFTLGEYIDPNFRRFHRWDSFSIFLRSRPRPYPILAKGNTANLPCFAIRYDNGDVVSEFDQDLWAKQTAFNVDFGSHQSVFGLPGFCIGDSKSIYLLNSNTTLIRDNGRLRYGPDPRFFIANGVSNPQFKLFRSFETYAVLQSDTPGLGLVLIPSRPFQSSPTVNDPVQLAPISNKQYPFRAYYIVDNELHQSRGTIGSEDFVTDQLFLSAIFYRGFDFNACFNHLKKIGHASMPKSVPMDNWFPPIDHADAIAIRTHVLLAAGFRPDWGQYYAFQNHMSPWLRVPQAALVAKSGVAKERAGLHFSILDTIQINEDHFLPLRNAPERRCPLTSIDTQAFAHFTINGSEFQNFLGETPPPLAPFPLSSDTPAIQLAKQDFVRYQQSIRSRAITNESGLSAAVDAALQSVRLQAATAAATALSIAHAGPAKEITEIQYQKGWVPRVTIDQLLRWLAIDKLNTVTDHNPTFVLSTLNDLMTAIIDYCIFQSRANYLAGIQTAIRSNDSRSAIQHLDQIRAYDKSHPYALDLLLFETTHGILLRPTQIQLIDEAVNGQGQTLIQRFTGSGKSTVFPLICHLLTQKIRTVVVITPPDLIGSMSERLNQVLFPLEKRAIVLDEPDLDDAEALAIRITSAQLVGYTLLMTPNTYHQMFTQLQYAAYTSKSLNTKDPHANRAKSLSRAIGLIQSGHLLLDECDVVLNPLTDYELAIQSDADVADQLWGQSSPLDRIPTDLVLGRDYGRYFTFDSDGSARFSADHVVAQPRSHTLPIHADSYFKDANMTRLLTWHERRILGLYPDEIITLIHGMQDRAKKEAIQRNVPYLNTTTATTFLSWMQTAKDTSPPLDVIDPTQPDTLSFLLSRLGKIDSVIGYFLHFHRQFTAPKGLFKSTPQQFNGRVTGASASTTAHPATFKLNPDPTALGEFIASVCQPTPESDVGLSPYTFETTDPFGMLKEWIRSASRPNGPRVLIDAGAFFQLDPATIIRIIYTETSTPPDRVIMVDHQSGLPTTYHPDRLPQQLIGATTAKDWTIYLNRHCIGTDIQHPPGTHAWVTTTGESVTDMLQASGRMRQYNNKWTFVNGTLRDGHGIRLAIRSDHPRQAPNVSAADLLTHAINTEFKTKETLAGLELIQALIQAKNKPILDAIKRTSETVNTNAVKSDKLSRLATQLVTPQSDEPIQWRTSFSQTIVDTAIAQRIHRFTSPIPDKIGTRLQYVRVTATQTETAINQVQTDRDAGIPKSMPSFPGCRMTTVTKSPGHHIDPAYRILLKTGEDIGMVRPLSCVLLNRDDQSLTLVPETWCGPLADCTQSYNAPPIAVSRVGPGGISRYIGAMSPTFSIDWLENMTDVGAKI